MIFLFVLLYAKCVASKENLNAGQTRNIYFPFDIINDTAIEVATEMVDELEIRDLEPLEIAEMIEEEISILVPTWKDWGTCKYQQQHSFSYEEEDDISNHHPFLSSSSSSSSHSPLPIFSSSYKNIHLCENHHPFARDWHQGPSLLSTNYANSVCLVSRCGTSINSNRVKSTIWIFGSHFLELISVLESFG